MKNILLFFTILFLSGCMPVEKKAAGFQPDFISSSNPEADFISPPDYAKPRAYWWWLEGNISKEGIRFDLTEMKKAGLRGAIVFDAGSSSYTGMKRTDPGPVFMSDEWRELFAYACMVADSLDMEISLNIGSGWNDGGPWVTPEETSKKAGMERIIRTGAETVVRKTSDARRFIGRQTGRKFLLQADSCPGGKGNAGQRFRKTS